MSNVVIATNLVKNYRLTTGVVNVFNDLSFTVAKGSSFAIRGVNGSGKSTLLRLIAGLLLPNQGSLNTYGSLGVLLSNEHAAYPRLSVLENLQFFAALHGLTLKQAKAQAEKLATNWQISELSNRRLDSLSVGQCKRFSLLRAILHEPEILILDEPLSGLDGPGIELTKQLVREWRLRGHTVIFTTMGQDPLSGLQDEELVLHVK